MPPPASRATGPLPPRLDPVRPGGPGGLSEGSADQWVAGADLDGLHFSGLDVAELTLDHATVRDCLVSDVTAREAGWAGLRLADSVLQRVAVPVVRAPRTAWRDVRLEAARLGSVEAYDSTWRSVHLVGCKIDYLNLRAAQLLDVALTDCVVEELDLTGATVRRLHLDGTRLARLEARGTRCEDVDLRGADLAGVGGLDGLRGVTISSDQLTRLAPLLARERGIEVLDRPGRT